MKQKRCLYRKFYLKCYSLKQDLKIRSLGKPQKILLTAPRQICLCVLVSRSGACSWSCVEAQGQCPVPFMIILYLKALALTLKFTVSAVGWTGSFSDPCISTPLSSGRHIPPHLSFWRFLMIQTKTFMLARQALYHQTICLVQGWANHFPVF